MLNLYEGTVSFCQIEGDWNINRRKKLNGVIYNAPNPSGLTDKTMNVLKFSDNEGVIRSILFNYGCHSVALGSTYSISAEFPGRICQILESQYYGLTPMFFQVAGAHERPKITFDGKRFKNLSFENLNELACQISSRIDNSISYGKFQ